ncbi:RDD family protein [Rhodococcus sp. HNM0569]|uniref:RDD family protein n=1 Tax=Rhodococcus sp. HNM0569 TaxID=2716340 RepID=UPI00146E8376|nr:RDD family protein [Rhodococcus sp. HNM0569]NLU83601.1 RDD family protein [Rhodococcus sp. HNM0569]
MSADGEREYRSFMDIRYGVDKMLEEAERRQRELDARPIPHGARPDERYPSPRTARRIGAFFVDWALHLAVLCVMATLMFRMGPEGIVLPVVGWIAVSFVHRVVVQSVTRATLGKAIFGLRIVRREDGGAPDFGYLLKWWLRGVPASLVAFRVGARGFDFYDEVFAKHPVFPCSVRTIDLKETADPLRA